jgi:hypothetical protein
MSGLQTRLAQAMDCESRYGIFQECLHWNLLWYAFDAKLKKIEYESYVPSWSWMAYSGGVRFLDITLSSAQWVVNLGFDQGRDYKHALIADVGKFRNCTIESEGDRYAVFDLTKTNMGWIRYDVEDSKNFLEEHCVFVGATSDSEYYYILVARSTSAEFEYERIGIGLVSKDCLTREWINVRVV